MIRSGLVNMIREKAMEGKSAYAISKETGVAENTAKRYIAAGETAWAQRTCKRLQTGSVQV